MRETVRVELGPRSYDILVGDRLLADAGTLIKPLLKSDFVIIVSDESVSKLYLKPLSASLQASSIQSRALTVPPGEASKNFAALGDLLDRLLAEQPDRKTTLLALGGGVVGDLAGFAASILLRGVDFIQIPTTLLAQVDSSVGGKTGVNAARGKNLIGSFHQPRLVLADVSTLSTLSDREKKAGYAEIAKYGLINDAAFFGWLEKNGTRVISGDAAAVTQAVVHSCKAKAAIVAADEKESGVRALLNFGHTFAHAIEAECGYDNSVLHGEAVALGMILAFSASVKLGLCKEEDRARVVAHFKATGLPTSFADIPKSCRAEALADHFAQDKKAEGGKPTFVLTHGVGSAFVARDVEKSKILQALVEAGAGV